MYCNLIQHMIIYMFNSLEMLITLLQSENFSNLFTVVLSDHSNKIFSPVRPDWCYIFQVPI